MLSKKQARAFFLGGTTVTFLIFIGLTIFSFGKDQTQKENITESVVRGKYLWESNNCMGCHTILGEGAYYAPELMNVFNRRGASDEVTFKAYMQGWMAAQPLAVPDRRKMPQFNLSNEEVDHLSDFLIWTSKVNANDWPPTIEG